MAHRLKEIKPARGVNQNISEGARTKVPPRTQVATDAGLSHHQRNTALRVASIPSDEFGAAVESDNPPTVTELAERGTDKKPLVDLGDRTPAQFQAATYAFYGRHRLLCR